jgi:hypothetical protein
LRSHGAAAELANVNFHTQSSLVAHMTSSIALAVSHHGAAIISFGGAYFQSGALLADYPSVIGLALQSLLHGVCVIKNWHTMGKYEKSN